MTEKIEKKFGVINGGEKGPLLNKEAKKKEIDSRIQNQEDLSVQEKNKLVSDVHQDNLLTIKEGILKFSGKILTDDEAIFIGDRIFGLASKNEIVVNELKDKFPELADYFENIMKEMDKLREELYE